MTNKPCFDIAPDEHCAYTESGLAAVVQRSEPATDGTHLVVECVP